MARQKTKNPKRGDRIRDIRLELGLSPDELARKLGISRPTIYNWEKGDNLKTENAKRLARLSGYPTWYIMAVDDIFEDYELKALEGVRRLDEHARAQWFSMYNIIAEQEKFEGPQRDSSGD